MKKKTSEDKPNDTLDEDEVDGCCCQFHDVEMVPDEDLPAAIGGVE